MASTPFSIVAADNGQGGTLSNIPSAAPVANNPPIPTGGASSSFGLPTEISNFANLFGVNSNPNGNNQTQGMFSGLQSWVSQNPLATLLLGLLLFAMLGNAMGPKGSGD